MTPAEFVADRARQAATATQGVLSKAEEELARIACEIAIATDIQEPDGPTGQAKQVSQV